MRGSVAETANLLTKTGCSATINEPTEAKAYERLGEIIDFLNKVGIREIYTNISSPKLAEVTLSNGNLLELRWLHD